MHVRAGTSVAPRAAVTREGEDLDTDTLETRARPRARIVTPLASLATPATATRAWAPPTLPSAERPRVALSPGASVGPYVLERLLGTGGMGVVYAARDSRLDRVVALKLLRSSQEGGREQLEERLRRESKALARLSHPNVTAVYELGTAADEIFIAMEYVAGTTLREWMQRTRPEPRVALATFCEAAKGLAAAHAAGLVHRDFKPDNVLLGTNGSVKVTDFGLARIAGDVRAVSDGLSSPSPSDEELTLSGSLIGTPAYMAPEQYAGATVDARADQFAFCVALYEALFGQRPFRGPGFGALRDAVLAGRYELPRDRRVGRRVRAALQRGLAVAPDARFASMDELLAAISPRRTTLAVAAGGGVLVAASAAVAATLLSRTELPPVCKGAPAAAEAVWNPTRRAQIERAFLTSGAPEARTTWAAVAQGLDAYVGRWTAQHTQTCEATRIHREQSEAALDLRTACLERHRAEVDALVGVLAHADRDVVRHARQAVTTLPDLAACSGPAALARRAAERPDPATQMRHDALVSRLDIARANVAVAKYDAALPLLDAVLAEPVLKELPELEAKAQHLRAKVLGTQGHDAEAEQSLFHGLAKAQAARADELVATISVDLAHTVGFRSQRTEEGLRWVELATGAIAAKGGDDLLSARLETVRGSILVQAGKPAEAIAANRKALEIAVRKAKGSPLEGETHNALGMALAMQGKFAEAVPLFEKALANTIDHYGEMHSLTGSVRMNLANALSSMQRTDEALAQYTAALTVNEAVFGPDSTQVAIVLSNLGQVLQERRRIAEARAHLERALAIRQRVYGDDHPAVARTATNLGYVMLEEKAYRAALAQFTRVGAVLERHRGANHPARLDDLAGLGLAYIGLGKPVEAIAPLTRAVAIAEGMKGDPIMLAEHQATLASVLYQSGRDRARGLDLARTARRTLAAAGEAKAVAEIDAWLAKRR